MKKRDWFTYLVIVVATMGISLGILALAGCDCPQVPGNGQLVIIDLDDGFWTNDLVVIPTDLQNELLGARADHDFDDAAVHSEMAAVRAGVHYWNKLGANLRFADEVSDNGSAPHFGVHRDSFSWPGMTIQGVDWEGLPYVTIYPSAMRNNGELTYRKLRENVAHELGHAIGLNHLPQGQIGTMQPVNYWQGDMPSRDDQAQYCTLYPGCTKIWR